jgi:hypothetical protein
MASGSPAAGGSNAFKSIIIGVITTVLGAAAVYFLGFHDKKENPKKEATQNAMKSIIQYEQILEKSIMGLACNSDNEYAQQAFLKEIEQLKGNMMNIKSEKDVDNRVFSLIDRRVTSLNELTEASEEMFSGMASLRRDSSTLEEEEFVGRNIALQKTYNDRTVQIAEEERILKTDIIAALKKEYDLKFDDIKSLQLDMKDANITGKWLINAVVKWDIKPDHTFTWSFEDKMFDGNWTLKKDTLHIKFSHPEEADFKIFQLYNNILSYKNMSDGTVSVACRQ